MHKILTKLVIKPKTTETRYSNLSHVATMALKQNTKTVGGSFNQARDIIPLI